VLVNSLCVFDAWQTTLLPGGFLCAAPRRLGAAEMLWRDDGDFR